MLLDTAREGDSIITLEVSRLSRSTQQLCEIINIIRQKRLRLVIVGSITVDCRNGEMDAMTKAFLQISAVFCELEVSMLRARVKSSLQHAKAQGRKLGRPQTTKDDIPATVKTIEYDPNRSANIALLVYADGEKRYILAPLGLQVGDMVLSGETADIKPGNALEIKNIPVGTMIHNIEMKPGKGGQLVRSAGNAAQLMAKEGNYAQVRLPSGEVRMIPMNARATIGQVGNIEHENINIGKAGRKRHMGWRPTVRGSVMNPNDHPHGGGEGKAPIGRPGPVTPWGKPALGYKTRKTKNQSDKFIVRRRNGK